MKALLILICAVPILVGFLVANLFGFRKLYKAGELSVNLETILKVISAKYDKVNYEFKKRAWVGIPLNNEGVAIIDERYRHSTSSKEIAQQLIKLGLSGLWEDHQKLIQWRIKYVKLGYILPPLTFVGCVLGTIVGRVPAMWTIIIVGLVLAGCICFLWFSRAVEKEAASQMASLIERTRVLHRVSEEEDLIESIHAWTWVSVLPGIAISFLINKQQKEIEGLGRRNL
ncbi:MAG: hypothetical protein ACSHX6_11965 [Akkermansiaceae bacterium]